MDRKDPVPIIPPKILGFKQPSGEIHVEDDGSIFACPGQDNDNSLCSTGDVKNIFEASVEDHFGTQLFDLKGAYSDEMYIHRSVRRNQTG